MERKHVSFDDWARAYFQSDMSRLVQGHFTIDDLRAAFNSGRTEGRPRVWRYKRSGGKWQVEFMELPNETSSNSKQSVSNEERLSDSSEVSSTEATDSQV